MICRLHAAAANENGKRRAKLAHERAHLAAADVVGDRRDIEIRALEDAVQLRHVWEFFPARCAPGRPEVHECDLAAIILEPDGFAREVRQRKRWFEPIASMCGGLRELRQTGEPVASRRRISSRTRGAK